MAKFNPNLQLQSESIGTKFKTWFLTIFVLCSLIGFIYEAYQFFEARDSSFNFKRRGLDKYCGNSTCYELLQVQRDATQTQIKKSFRELAKIYHPDKNRETDTTQLFQVLNKAYETLSSQKGRFIYDLYLDNPEQSEYMQQYEYYAHKYDQMTQIPVWAVIIGIISCASWLQYVMRKQMYQSAIQRISLSPDFKIKVNERCYNKKKAQKQIIRQQMISQIQIQGGYSNPSFRDILAYKIVIFPVSLISSIYSNLIWFLNYLILRKDYSEKDKEYLTMKALQISSQARWNVTDLLFFKNIDQDERKDLIIRKLWVPENKKAYIQQKRQEWLQKLKAQNPNKHAMVMKYLKVNKIQ